MERVKEKQQNIFNTLKDEFGYTNEREAPRLEKIVVATGTGKRQKQNPKANDFIEDRLAKITGQKPATRLAKKSIASFKIREGDPIGKSVTLRGDEMNTFLDKLIHIALPRTKDFRGIPRTSIDELGNATIGIREHTIFPETSDEELKNVFGLAVTLVTTASTKEEAERFLEEIGIPFQKKEADSK